MNLDLSFLDFKFQIAIRKQDSTEKGKPDTYRLQIVTSKSVYSKAFESRYRAFKALDVKLAEFLASEESLTNRVVYANLRECIQALHSEELQNLE